MSSERMGRSIKAKVAAAALVLVLTSESASPASPGPGTPASAAAERIGARDIRADFIMLYEHLRAAHFNLYARRSKAEYDRRFEEVLRELRRPEERLDVARRFQRFAAFGRVAHARIDFAYQAYRNHLADGGRTFPLLLRPIDGRAFVVADNSGVDTLSVGDEIIALNGRPIAAWLERCARNLSADTDYMAAALLELDMPMMLWLELGDVPGFDLVVRRSDGTRAEISVPARTQAEMRAAAQRQPPRLDLSTTDRTARMLGGGIAYLRPGPFYNSDPNAADPYDNTAFRRFIDEAFARFMAENATKLIIDLRDNPGGDSSFSDLMISWFADRPYRFNSAFRIKVSPEAVEANRRRVEAAPSDSNSISNRFAALYAGARPGDIVEFDTPLSQPRSGQRFQGQVFVIVNRNSFSNAVAVAATIQDYRFGTIIGEETSDLATTYGAMETFMLPRTGLIVGFPKAQIIRPSGDTASRGVVPDIPVPTPLFEGPDDPVLSRAVSIVARQPAS